MGGGYTRNIIDITFKLISFPGKSKKLKRVWQEDLKNFVDSEGRPSNAVFQDSGLMEKNKRR